MLLVSLLVCSHVCLAGDLNPPSAPEPTMKTLDQVEPRIPIGTDTTPGDADSLYKITSPGSYYLTGNVNITSNFKHAILIDSDDVTVDLTGYRLWSSWVTIPPGANLDFDGIHIAAECKNIEIRNGTIASDNHTAGLFTYRGFRKGLSAENDTDGIRIKDIRVSGARESGIELLGNDNLVKGCTVSDNGTSVTSDVYGIYALSGSTVTGNTVNNNGESVTSDVYGIKVGWGSTVSGNTVSHNGDSASGSYGIYASIGCTVTGNTTRSNGYYAVGTVYGIRACGSTVTGNMAYFNGYNATGTVYGIYADTGSTVTGNTAYHNGDSATNTAYGIYLAGYNLVDQNTAYGNGTGAGSATNITYGVTGCVYGINVPPAP